VLRSFTMQWYYVDGNNEQQPFVAKDAPSLAQYGVLTGDTLVWNEELADWEPADGHFPEIFQGQEQVSASVAVAAPAPAAASSAALIQRPQRVVGLKTVPASSLPGSAVSRPGSAGDSAPLVKRIASELAGASGWMKLVGFLSYATAVLYFLGTLAVIVGPSVIGKHGMGVILVTPRLVGHRCYGRIVTLLSREVRVERRCGSRSRPV
jgi:hypothetical protein